MNEQEYYILTSVGDWTESRSTSPYIEVKFRGLDGHHYKTYITSGMRNFKHWRHLLNGNWGVYTNIKLKSHDLINADSNPEFVEALTLEEVTNFDLYGGFDAPESNSLFEMNP